MRTADPSLPQPDGPALPVGPPSAASAATASGHPAVGSGTDTPERGTTAHVPGAVEPQDAPGGASSGERPAAAGLGAAVATAPSAAAMGTPVVVLPGAVPGTGLGAEGLGDPRGREVPPRVLRERLRRIERVWMVAGAGIEEQEWFRRSRREQAKLATFRQDFTELSRVGVRSGTVALHERNGPPPAVGRVQGPRRESRRQRQGDRTGDQAHPR